MIRTFEMPINISKLSKRFVRLEKTNINLFCEHFRSVLVFLAELQEKNKRISVVLFPPIKVDIFGGTTCLEYEKKEH